MPAKKRNRVDSRAHTACPQCKYRVHGERGLRMHLARVHGVEPKPMTPSERLDRLMRGAK